jgi:hypothetical protein
MHVLCWRTWIQVQFTLAAVVDGHGPWNWVQGPGSSCGLQLCLMGLKELEVLLVLEEVLEFANSE